MLCWCYETFFSSVRLCFKFVELYSEVFIYSFIYFSLLLYKEFVVLLPHRTSKKISITNCRFAGLTLLNLTGILHGQHSSETDFSSALLIFFYLQRHSSLVTQHKKREGSSSHSIIDVCFFFVMD